MTQEDKELLLKDLCTRLPFRVKVRYSSYKEFITCTLHSINPVYDNVHLWSKNACFSPVSISKIKPYLFPLSSQTEEMLKELNANGFFKYRDDITNVSNIKSKNGISKEIYTYIGIENISFLTDYFYSHHIDYRGLIEKGLAIDATNLNIY